MMLDRKGLEEIKHIGLYQEFIEAHPKLKPGRKRKRAYLKRQKVKKGTHIWEFFMED